MPDSLSPSQHIMRICADFRMGLAVVFDRGDTRWLLASLETLSDERFLHMRHLGPLELVISNRRAKALKAPKTAGKVARFLSAELCELDQLKSIADAQNDNDITLSGFIPAHAQDDNAQAAAVAICKIARLLPAALAVKIPAQHHIEADLHRVALNHIETALEEGVQSPLRKISDAALPLEISKHARLHVFRAVNGAQEHYAIQIGQPDYNSAVLTRLHSSCFTGDVLRSLKCDCHAQLHGALDLIATHGAGVLLYLNQEGRGIGLANKMRAYHLQNQGYDTVEANHCLGFEDDERNFGTAAQMLVQLGVSTIDLLTNNPAKVEQIRQAGIIVKQRIALVVGKNPHNANYLAIKAAKSGHIL